MSLSFFALFSLCERVRGREKQRERERERERERDKGWWVEREGKEIKKDRFRKSH